MNLSDIDIYLEKMRQNSSMDIETIHVINNDDIIAAYAEGEMEARGNYKIFCTSNVLFINFDMISIILDIFSEEDIGIITTTGTRSGKKYGQRLLSHILYGTIKQEWINPEKYVEVDSTTDGVIITSKDLNWEDCLSLDDFCKKAIYQGYRIVVPHQEKTWILLDEFES